MNRQRQPAAAHSRNSGRRATAGPDEIAGKVRAYIISAFLSDEEATAFRDDHDLLTVLNSLQILRMVIELEKELGIRIENSELTAVNLSSVQRMAAFFARKLEAR